jgi:cysteine desulfurase
MKRIYLDNAATTPKDKRVFEAILPCLTEIYGNPSSLHDFGQDARHVMEESRNKGHCLYKTGQMILGKSEIPIIEMR